MCGRERGIERWTRFSLWSDSSHTGLPAGPQRGRQGSSLGLALGSLHRASPGAGAELIRGRDSLTDRCSSYHQNWELWSPGGDAPDTGPAPTLRAGSFPVKAGKPPPHPEPTPNLTNFLADSHHGWCPGSRDERRVLSRT